jgi:hypothetical protein
MLRSQAAGAVDWWSGLFALLAGEQGPWVAASCVRQAHNHESWPGTASTACSDPAAAGGPQRRWLARPAFVLLLAAAVVIGFAGLASVVVVSVGAAGVCLVVAGGYWFLAHRGAEVARLRRRSA